MKKQFLRKIAESFYTFLTMPDEVKIYVELIDRSEAEITMQSRTPDDCEYIYSIKF